MEHPGRKTRSWRREDETGEYMISTALKLLDHDFINEVFATDDAYWTGPINDPGLFSLMLSQSLNFGLYEVLPASKGQSSDSSSSPRTPSPTLGEADSDAQYKQIGIARFVTDYVTFVYITDVYIVSEHRGRGFGRWLMKCWEEVLRDMPQLRRVLLLTGSDKTQKWYEQGLEMWDSRAEGEQFHVMTRKRYKS